MFRPIKDNFNDHQIQLYTKGYMVHAGNALLQNKSVFIRLQHMLITFKSCNISVLILILKNQLEIRGGW